MSIRQALTSSTAAYIAGNKYSVENLGQSVESDTPLVDARLHLKDGTLLSNSGIYTNFVEYMENLSINDPNADNFCTEQEWQSSVSTYGCCGSYVVDTTNHTVRLPKVSADNDRYLVKAYTSGGITCRIYSDGWCEQSGYIPPQTRNDYLQVTLLTSYASTDYLLDINTRLAVYSESLVAAYSYLTTNKTVSGFAVAADPNIFTYWCTAGYINLPAQTLAKKYSYVCVATSVKQPAVVEIDNVVTDLNGKADVDLTNVSNTSGFRRLVEVSPKSLLPSWYKVYSEYDPATGEFIGQWCEQGGICHGFTPVTLVKPYLDTNYTLLLSILGTGTTYGYYYGGAIINNASFQAGSIATAANEHRWETKGYIS